MAQEEMDNEKLVVEVELNGEINVEDTPTAVVPSESNGLLKVDGIFSTVDVEDVEEGIRAIVVYNEWVSPTVTSRRPLARYQVMNNQADQELLLVVIDLSNFVFSLETYSIKWFWPEMHGFLFCEERATLLHSRCSISKVISDPK